MSFFYRYKAGFREKREGGQNRQGLTLSLTFAVKTQQKNERGWGRSTLPLKPNAGLAVLPTRRQRRRVSHVHPCRI